MKKSSYLILGYVGFQYITLMLNKSYLKWADIWIILITVIIYIVTLKWLGVKLLEE